jgi:uncharacterized membrane protein
MEPFGWWWPGMGFMWIFPLFFLVGMALCVLFMFRGGWWSGHRHGRHLSSGSALDILDRRFARGEIDRAKYDEMRAALRH